MIRASNQFVLFNISIDFSIGVTNNAVENISEKLDNL
jgi:hypothetical protein